MVQGACKNRKKEHTLDSLYPIVEPGFRVVETPNNVVHLLVNDQHSDTVIRSLVDQDGHIINFLGVVITVQLEQNRDTCRRSYS